MLKKSEIQKRKNQSTNSPLVFDSNATPVHSRNCSKQRSKSESPKANDINRDHKAALTTSAHSTRTREHPQKRPKSGKPERCRSVDPKPGQHRQSKPHFFERPSQSQETLSFISKFNKKCDRLLQKRHDNRMPQKTRKSASKRTCHDRLKRSDHSELSELRPKEPFSANRKLFRFGVYLFVMQRRGKPREPAREQIGDGQTRKRCFSPCRQAQSRLALQGGAFSDLDLVF